MIRTCRSFVPDIPVHIVLYGYQRCDCFYMEKDYQFYLKQLRPLLNRYNISLHAYVLMSNHIHLLITQNSKEGIDMVLRTQARFYQEFVRKNYGITEPVWQKNYKASYINPKDYLLKLYQFIELNPVRAGLVDSAGEYVWSSFAFHALNEKNTLIKEHAVFQSIANTNVKRNKLYSQLCQTELSKNELIEIKSAIQKEVAMGDKSFNDQIQLQLLEKKQNYLEDDMVEMVN